MVFDGIIHFCQKLQKYSYFLIYKTDTWLLPLLQFVPAII